jgi:PAS domain S-box-containing protein
MTEIYIITGPQRNQFFDIENGEVTIGRSPDSDIQIKDSSVSRHHVKIFKRGGKFFIQDLHSTNGTFLDDERIRPEKEYEISEGQPISVAKVMISLGRSISKETVAIKSGVPYELADTGEYEASIDRPQTTSKNLELIYRVSSVLTESVNIREFFEKMMDFLFELLKRVDRGAILLVDEETGKFEEIISRSKYDDQSENLNYSRTVVNRAVEKGRPVMIPDMRDAEMEDLSESMGLIRSVLCVPLISRSQIRGVIYVDSVDMPHGFRSEDIALLSALSSPAAVALENALLYTNLEQIADERAESLRAAEKRLGESEARLKAIFDNMSSGVVVYKAVNDGEDFIILDLNKADQKIEKVKRHEVLGKSVLEVFPEMEETALLNAFRRVWETGKSERRSVVLKQKEGGNSWREYRIYRLPSKEIVAIFDDVTEKVKSEEDQKVLQKQLFVSQKMESIGAFAGGTAHNFRNILQAISGNVEYLELAHGEKPEIKELARSVYDSIEKGVDLINNLLHFSKTGDEVELADIDLGEVIHETYRIVEKVFDRNIQVELKLGKDLNVRGNHSLLSQVFMNLYTNARDAMPDGGVLSIEARRVGDRVVAVVSDSGCGMDPGTTEKIFDPFFTLKEVGKGTGLGLSTSHGIIEQHKGSITVTSKPGQGTTFRIFLPYQKPAVQKEARPEQEIVLGKGEKVLIVDDEGPALDALANLTESLGYKAIALDRSAEALKSYSNLAPDVVLMDRNLPEMDGVTCIKEIVKTDPKARIVIVSGYEETGPQGIDDETKNLIKGYITKPCGRKELSQMLSAVLGG